jgi:hypothetical protein
MKSPMVALLSLLPTVLAAAPPTVVPEVQAFAWVDRPAVALRHMALAREPAYRGRHVRPETGGPSDLSVYCSLSESVPLPLLRAGTHPLRSNSIGPSISRPSAAIVSTPVQTSQL